MSNLSLNQSVGCSVQRANGNLFNEFSPKGKFHIEIHRKDGTIEKFDITNGITNVGKNMLLGVMFHGDTPSTTWYIGLVDNAGFSAFSASDTSASHAGWTESSAYSESVRQTWTAGAASGQSITNSVALTFTCNTNSTVLHGVFVIDVSTKGGSTGNLWSTAAFNSNVSCNSGDLVKVTYTVSC